MNATSLGLGLGMTFAPATPDSGVPANALLADDGTPILNDDGSYILVD